MAEGVSMGAEWVIMHNEVTAANVRWTCSVALLRTRVLKETENPTRDDCFGYPLLAEQTSEKYVGTES